MRADPGGIFDSDVHRRVAGNLSQPRSFEDLVAFLTKNDPHAVSAMSRPDGSPPVERTIENVLKDLEKQGYVTSGFEDASDGDSIVKAVNKESNAITLHKEKAANLVQRVDRDKAKYAGKLYILTPAGVDRLNQGLPDEPEPMDEQRLAAANEQDRKLVEEDERKLAEDKK